MSGNDREPQPRTRGGDQNGGLPPGQAASAQPGARQGTDPRAAKRSYGAWRAGGKGSGVSENAGWAIVSYLVAGMFVYGGLGWLIGRWTGLVAVLFPVGVLVGLILAIVLVVLRYGRF